MQVITDIFVGGKWIPSTSERTLIVRSPSTEEPVAQVPDASTADVDAAVAAARHAFDDGPWPRMTPADRAEVMASLLAELTDRADELAQIIGTENGTPVMMLRAAQVDNGLDVLGYYTDLATELEVETLRAGRYTPALVRREPVGTVAAIVPWNVPFFLTMMKVAPALAAGCTIVLKAAPETPLNANFLAAVADSVGLPAGVLNVIAAGPESSEHLVTHPGIDKIAFTGSTAVGKRIAGLAASQLKRVTLELGGKSAAIVLDDADLATTIPRAARRDHDDEWPVLHRPVADPGLPRALRRGRRALQCSGRQGQGRRHLRRHDLHRTAHLGASARSSAGLHRHR